VIAFLASYAKWLRSRSRAMACAGELTHAHDSGVSLTQASRTDVHWAANGFAGHNQLNSPIHLAPGGVIVSSYWLRVAKAFGVIDPAETPWLTR